MTANEKNDRAYELYRALSDVDEKYVGEMLDDGIAEDIRAANRRKRITMRSSLTAVAAVFVLVIGIGILPNLSGLEKNDEAVMKQAAPSENIVQQDNDDTNKSFASTAAANDEAEEDEGEDNALMFGNKNEKEMFDGADDAEMAEDFTAEAEENEDTRDNGKNNNNVRPEAAADYIFGKLTLDDGSVVTVLRGELDSSVVDRPYSRKTAEGVVLYEVKNISYGTCLAVYYPSENIYRLALSGDLEPDYLTDEKLQEILGELQLSDAVTF